LLGLPKEEILGKNWIDNFVPFPHRLALEKGLHSIIEGGSVYDIHENPVMTRDKGDRMISWHNAFLKDESGEITGILSSGIDITDQSAALEALRESERSKSVLISHIPGMAYRCSSGADRTMYFISEGCNALTGYNVQDLINNGKVSYDDLICGEYREDVRNEWERAISAGKPFRYEYEIADASGERKWVMEMGQAVFGHEGDIEALEGIIIDITESKTALEKIRYMDKHDYMTGLYNRKYYELEKERIENEGQVPVSVVMVDINGLRLINDAFGHAAGDRLIIETAKIMQSCCGEGDVLARTGGGEFTAILPGTDMPKAFNMLDAIISKLNSYNSKISANEQAINLSIGFGIKDGENGTLAGAEKESGEYLRRGKLFEQKSHHNAVLSSLMATMYARSQETEEHSQRISRNCIRIAEKLGVPKNKQDEIHLFAMLHDIGKVGISDSILNKPGKLAAKEWAIMKTHPEIGYRIARSAPEFEGVADYILAHHERWDGKGYPYGLAGEKIPLLSRILAVADAYDAMTSESRAYRAPLTGKMALAEIRSNAGTQFDPNVVRAFIEIMDSSAD
jgi:diguanylate cyclase (GGDEF)-like protein/PAS domain S-box-containing protein